MKKFAAFDLVVLGYIAIVTLVVLAFRPPGTLIYLVYHGVVTGMIASIVYAHDRYGGRLWSFCRYWYVIPIVLGAFREIHWLVPQVHPFDDNRFDRILAGLDRRCFGDVDGFFLHGWPLFLADLLHLCYWFYFVSMLIPGAALYSAGDWKKLREYLAVIMLGMFTSYLGYFVVPAIGPHHFYHPRPAQLDGVWLGHWLHEAILAAEWRMPDAFPSGHALMSMIVIAMTWRLHRPSFRVVVVPALGCVLATMALRYHYVIDVAASLVLLPMVVYAGLALHRRWDQPVRVPPTEVPPTEKR
jgi:hypothetical protein